MNTGGTSETLLKIKNIANNHKACSVHFRPSHPVTFATKDRQRRTTNGQSMKQVRAK